MTLIVAYYRVSTARQGKSGLGLDAQRETVRAYADRHGAKIIAEYTEVESGKNSDRPELHKAIARSKRSKSHLVFAKLDRLARNAGFLLSLKDSLDQHGVPVVFCDYPNANNLTIGIMAVVAQDEARAISKRTKEALAQAKKRGVLLGSARPGHWDGREDRRLAGAKKGSQLAAKVNASLKQEAYVDLVDQINTLLDDGKSYRAIAKELNDQGYRTRRGKTWSHVQVKRVVTV